MQTRHWREGDLDGWTIPKLGEPASADLPRWLVERLCDGRMVINGFGGFTSNEESVNYVCQAGDTVILNDNRVEILMLPNVGADIAASELALAA